MCGELKEEYTIQEAERIKLGPAEEISATDFIDQVKIKEQPGLYMMALLL